MGSLKRMVCLAILLSVPVILAISLGSTNEAPLSPLPAFNDGADDDSLAILTTDGGFVVDHPRQHLRIAFDETAVTFSPAGACEIWKLSLIPVMLSRGDARVDIPPAAVTVNGCDAAAEENDLGCRLAYYHDGFSQFFTATSQGLSHTMQIDATLGGAGPLALDFEVLTDLSGGGDDGARFAYSFRELEVLIGGGLQVIDAAGTPLKAALTADAETMQIVIDDAHARYPLQATLTVATTLPRLTEIESVGGDDAYCFTAGAQWENAGDDGAGDNDCSSAITLSLPADVTGDTNDAGDDYHGTCSWARGPDDVYYFFGEAGNSYILDLRGLDWFDDTVLYVRYGDCEEGEEVGCNDDWQGDRDHSLVEFVAAQDGAYYAFVDGWASWDDGEYNLRVVSCDNGGCFIDGECWKHGDTNPENACQVCDTSESLHRWSYNDGASCDDGIFCNGADFCDQDQCTEHAGDPCTDDGRWCNGNESCNENLDQCEHTGTPCPDDGRWCNGVESCDEVVNRCVQGEEPCADDGVFCNGLEGCNEGADLCEHSGDPCPNDGLWCNGEEYCDEANAQCAAAAEPCPDDGIFCNGVEDCDENNDQCLNSGNPCPDDDLFCNGREYCLESQDTCKSTPAPCPNDGVFCNGLESCDENDDQCVSSGNPCTDDNLFCNGLEYCNENTDRCAVTEEPCGDDGLYCNGLESCNEVEDQCISSGNPCPVDDLWCNGVESCNEQNDQCTTTGSPCPDDPIFCNGVESCNEADDQCLHSGNPCNDDQLWCNGVETCNEVDDACQSSGNPCSDDTVFCNGIESCDENQNVCLHSGNPCIDDGLFCNGKEICDEYNNQ